MGLTLASMHNQACHWFTVAEFDAALFGPGHNQEEDVPNDQRDPFLVQKALSQLRKVHSYRIQKLGKEHPETKATEVILLEQSRRMRAHGGDIVARLKSYSSWKEFSTEEFPEMRTAEQFREFRALFKSNYGVER